MRYLTLVAQSDEYDNSPGFVFEGAAKYEGMMADRGDILLAHDIVEHQNGIHAIGSVWDELEACGGVWHARGRWGDLMQDTGSRYSPAENVASDIVRMARDVAWMDFRAPEAMGFRPPVTYAHSHDEDFLKILSVAREQIPGELDGEDLDIDLYLDEALARMRLGFRKANRRFGDRFASNNQMRAIKDEVARAASSIEYEGQRFRLAWGAGKCSIAEIYEDYE